MKLPGSIAGMLAGFLMFVASGSVASAHPHQFIDLKVDVMFDSSGKAVGLRQEWVFDALFTAYLIQGQDQNGDGKFDKAELIDMLGRLLTNMSQEDYFTVVHESAEPTKFGSAKPVAASIENEQLAIRFETPFAKPLGGKGKTFRYAVYDPTYYIAVLHRDGLKGVKLDAAAKGCKAEFQPSEPSTDQVALAASLGINQSAGNGLGIHFAEWVYVKC
ncbi:MAG: DUF1007 family protein [Pseudomonadota bacterium]